jgi:hypothetical protein
MDKAMEMLADRGRFPSGGPVPWDVCVSVIREALDAQEAEIKALTTALHDAINRPKGVVPASADPYYDPRHFALSPTSEDQPC